MSKTDQMALTGYKASGALNGIIAKMKKHTNTFEEFQAQAAGLMASLSPKKENATIIALYGNLGAGKTTFTQEIAKDLGINEPVTSPTFVIQKTYPIEDSKNKYFRNLVHIDAYRLHDVKELLALGWKELISDPYTLICIEWADNVKEAIPTDAYRITLEYVSEVERVIDIQKGTQ